MLANSGMALMMKSLGLDPDELKTNVEGFMAGMRSQAEAINANQVRIETKLDALDAQLRQVLEKLDDAAGPPASSTPILTNGKDTGVFVTDERFPQVMIDDVNKSQAQREE